jgi:hypothetical protein
MSRTDALNTGKDMLSVSGPGASPTVGTIGANPLRSDRTRSKYLLYACGDRHVLGIYLRGLRTAYT